jgi:hypothetical protein
MTVDQLPLQGRDEAPGHAVVVGIRYRSYRGQESGFFEAATKLNRGALATSVWVVDQAGRWPASVDSLAFNASSTRSVLRLLAKDHPTTFP